LNSNGVYNYAYDNEGNLIRRSEIASNQVTEYQWDYRNRLAGVFDKNATGNITQEVGFKYDAMNRRISKKVGSTETRFVYDRDNVLFDFAVSGANQPVLDKRYFYGTGVDQVLAQESAQGGVLWALTDQLGTVKDLVDNSGSVANHVRYDSFGGVVSQSNAAVGSQYGFTGRKFDAETGLYYYRSRYYNPGIGRFIGEDSVGFDGGDANLYRYVGNRPTYLVDPLGLYGQVIAQTREIEYSDKGQNKLTNDIKDLRDNDPSVHIISDFTIAVIIHTNDIPDKSIRVKPQQVKSRRGYKQDNRGHIVGRQLGGSNKYPNNFFAQDASINQNKDGLGYNWGSFESKIVGLLNAKSNPPVCPPIELRYSVNLSYRNREEQFPLRPTGVFAVASFTDGTVEQKTVPNNIPRRDL
jgi:RHS repeat-associated protein